VIAASEGLLFIEVDSWMTGINRNVEGKHVRRIMRYSGGHPAFRARCEAAVADGYREFGAGLGATGQRRESAMDVGMMIVFILPWHAVRSFGARSQTVCEGNAAGAQSAICCQGPGCRRMKRAAIRKMAL
jgi:hypothetical protein